MKLETANPKTSSHKIKSFVPALKGLNLLTTGGIK